MKEKILIVDDDPDMLCVFEELLKMEDYEVSCAYNGKEALKLFLASKPDMVLTDISMPVMNGIELIKAIRHDLLNITVPILVVSSMRLRNGEVNPGWNKFLQKPSDIDTMLSTIAELLGNKI